MGWQKIARLLVAVVGIGCAVAVYVYMRPRPQTEEPPPTALLPPDAVSVSKNSDFKLLGPDGTPIYQVLSDVRRTLGDNRMEFRGNVKLTFRRDGVPYTVTSDEADTSGVAGPTGEEQSSVVFRGKVRMNGEDGFSVQTEEATYLNVEQRLLFPGAVAFTRGRMSGTGVGGELFMSTSVFWLYDKAEMRIAPEGEGTPVVVTARQIGVADADRYMRVVDGARVTRENQTLASDLMMIYFAEGAQQTVQRIEMDGKSVVTQTGGGNRPDMRAEGIDLDFAPAANTLSHARLEGGAVLTTRDTSGVTRILGSTIDMNVAADGQTLTRLEAMAPSEVHLPRSGDTPARTIRSSGLIAEGAEPKGLDRAVFSGGVDYRETTPAGRGQPARSRVATSDSLVLGLSGGLNQVDRADFRQSFKVVDETLTATADEGQYDAKLETLRLRAYVPVKSQPRVVDQDIDVKAHEIDVDLKQDAFEARGGVQSLRKPSTKAGSKTSNTPGLFEAGKPINGSADTLKYSKATGLAVYTGTVALLQQSDGPGKESSVLRGDEVKLDETKQDLEATGNVRSTFFVEKNGAPSTPADKTAASTMGRTEMSSARMTYKEATRTATYAGTAQMTSTNGERLTADQIVVEMQTARRALKEVVAISEGTNLIRAVLPEGRQVTGLHLTYDAEAERYVVTGKPARFITASASKPGMCEVGTGTELSFLRTQGWSNAKNEGGAVGRAEDKKCAEVIK